MIFKVLEYYTKKTPWIHHTSCFPSNFQMYPIKMLLFSTMNSLILTYLMYFNKHNA